MVRFRFRFRVWVRFRVRVRLRSPIGQRGVLEREPQPETRLM